MGMGFFSRKRHQQTPGGVYTFFLVRASKHKIALTRTHVGRCQLVIEASDLSLPGTASMMHLLAPIIDFRRVLFPVV
jgi:hypothetical protein